MIYQFTNKNRVWLIVLFLTIFSSFIFFKMEKYYYSIFVIPVDIIILAFSRTIVFMDEIITLKSNYFPFIKNYEFRYLDVIEVSPLTRPSGFKIKFRNGVSNEFFFTNIDEFKPFYRLMIEKSVKINPKDFSYITNLVTEIRRDIKKKEF